MDAAVSARGLQKGTNHVAWAFCHDSLGYMLDGEGAYGLACRYYLKDQLKTIEVFLSELSGETLRKIAPKTIENLAKHLFLRLTTHDYAFTLEKLATHFLFSVAPLDEQDFLLETRDGQDREMKGKQIFFDNDPESVSILSFLHVIHKRSKTVTKGFFFLRVTPFSCREAALLAAPKS